MGLSLWHAVYRLVFLNLLWQVVHATSFLSDTLLRKGQIQDVLEHHPAKHTECRNSKPTGPIETTMCDYETMESVNEELFNHLSELVRLPFFKYFRVDLYRECPFWSDHGSCSDIGCAITTVDESDVPERWRSTTLSKLESSFIETRHTLPGCYYRDSDFCFLDDNTEGDYFDLSLVPERFTGYSGPDAHRIWRSIYEENCFGLSELSLMTGKSPAPVSLPDTMSEVFRDNGNGHEEHCLEKRVYYKIISGLHASISTHICREYLNQTTGLWAPNLECFVDRVASHPERLQYIYFNTVLLLRAVARLGPYLSAFDYCSSGTHEDDQQTLETVSKVIAIAQNTGKFDESVLFRGENANILKEEFKTHFRNVTRIMDCVGCDKCRLWGKVQTTGIATAMKILFEMDEKALDPHSNANLLQRAEVVALINTLHRFAESLEAVNEFRAMWSAMSRSDSEKLIVETEKGRLITFRQPRPSALVGEQDPANMLGDVQNRLASMIRVCKDSTVGCMSLLVEVFHRGMNVLFSVFKGQKIYGEL
ncbi:endoplasmic oxidoreductin [Tricholoma matsutake]|nr:endoplasmic oxidoreductin [Tricholoma matsutake 945]